MSYVVRAYYYGGGHLDIAIFRFKAHALEFLASLDHKENHRLIWYGIRERVNFKLTVGPTKSV